MGHPADKMVQSAHAALIRADEYLIPAAAPVGALVKADAIRLVVDAQKDGKLRLNCSSWEDARVLLPGEMLGIRRDGTFWVLSRLDPQILIKPQSEGNLPMTDTAHGLRYAIREALHGARTRFDQVETVAASEIHGALDELRLLANNLLELEGGAKPTVDVSALQSLADGLTKQLAELTAANASLQGQFNSATAALMAADQTIAGLRSKLDALTPPQLVVQSVDSITSGIMSGRLAPIITPPLNPAPTASEAVVAGQAASDTLVTVAPAVDPNATPVPAAQGITTQAGAGIASPAATLTGDPAPINPTPGQRLSPDAQMAPNQPALPPAQDQPQVDAAPAAQPAADPAPSQAAPAAPTPAQ